MAENETPTPARYTGVARGGPLDGQELISRFPEGVLAVWRPTCQAWVYDYWPAEDDSPAFFLAREEEARTLDDARRLKTALEDCDYDVVSLPEPPAVT